MIFFPIRAALEAGVEHVVLVLAKEQQLLITEAMQAEFGESKISSVVQNEARGTGDAARAGLSQVPESCEKVLILYGDTPLIEAKDIAPLMQESDSDLSLLSCIAADPFGYGRLIFRDDGSVSAIVEQKDLKESQQEIREVNAGIYFASRAFLDKSLANLKDDNAQKEYLLTDIVAQSSKARACFAPEQALAGVNDRLQLNDAAEVMNQRILNRHRKNGATIENGVRIDDAVSIAADVYLQAGVRLEGGSQLAEGTHIEAGTVIKDSQIGENSRILPYCHIVESVVAADCELGPFAHLRPQTVLGTRVKIGNFVEVKKSRLDTGVKVNHLSYIGDAEIGEATNVGAGTICCNYDGFNKAKTIIGKGCFVGSDTQLIAPIKIGDGAYIATGTTVTMDIPEDALAISRSRQQNKEGYALRLKANLLAKKKASKLS